MKRMAAVLFFLAFFLYNGNACADASAAIVIEESTGRILYASNENERLPMASTTKIMTALVALENSELDEVVTASENAFGVPGTSIYLEKGESLTLEQMLYGLMLASGNDAAVAIAEHVGGSVDGFCAMMNARAAALGCLDTHFVTPHGLPSDNHYTTAKDLVWIAREALKIPIFRKIVSTQRATLPWANHTYDRVLNNKNKLLSTYPGAIGVKTGYTKAAGRCLVFAAERNDMTLIGVVLNCPDWFVQSQALLDVAFADYKVHTALESGEAVRDILVLNGTLNRVTLEAGASLASPIAQSEDPEIVFTWPESIEAGFDKGAILGSAALVIDGQEICSVPLIAAEAVPRRSFHDGISRTIRNWCIAP